MKEYKTIFSKLLKQGNFYFSAVSVGGVLVGDIKAF